MVDFALTDRELEIQRIAEEFTQQYVTPYALDLDAKNEFPHDVVQKAHELKLTNLHVPRELGGPERTMLEETLVGEAIGYGCVGVATSIMTNNLALAPLLMGCQEDQLKKYVTPLVTSDKYQIVSFCLTERGAGSDAAAVATRAVQEGDEYVINGMKCFITGAPVASLMTVFASTDPEARHKGISCFIVPADTPGVSIGHIENKMGQKASVQSEVHFKDVHVPTECLVGNEGDGFRISMMTLDMTRASIASMATGLAQRALDEAARFANLRQQFGKPIGRFQGISFMLSDMACRTEASRLLSRHAAWLADKKIRNTKESAFAKYYASDSAMQNALDAVQILGGYGYMVEYPTEKLVRDAKLLQIYEGTNQIQQVVAGGQILKESTLDKKTGFKLDYKGKDGPQI